MPKNKVSNSSNNATHSKNEDRGLTPITSGTPMPKVKPAAKPATSQNNKKS